MKKIVMIDPSETFVRFISRVLVRMGYEVHHAGDMESGLAIIAEVQPNLVLAELNLPHCKGREICEKLRSDSRSSTIPLVIVTTDGRAESMALARQAGCTDYLTKPLTVRDIHLMLQRNLPFVVKREMLRLEIGVNAIIRSKDQQIETRTKTLGEGGMLVHSNHQVLQEGSQVTISLGLPPSHEHVELTGEVIYILDPVVPHSLPGVGIRFTDITRETAENLRQFIEGSVSAEPENPAVATAN
jgi:DNA-binding response OmpR family regulator